MESPHATPGAGWAVRRLDTGDEALLRRLRIEALIDPFLAWVEGESLVQVELFVACGNDRAQRLYERNGFRVMGPEHRCEQLLGVTMRRILG